MGQKARLPVHSEIGSKKPLFTGYDKYTGIYLSDSGAQPLRDKRSFFPGFIFVVRVILSADKVLKNELLRCGNKATLQVQKNWS